jgi:hypothetical protein
MILADSIGLTKIPFINKYLIKQDGKETKLNNDEGNEVSSIGIGDFLAKMNKVNSEYFDI